MPAMAIARLQPNFGGAWQHQEDFSSRDEAMVRSPVGHIRGALAKAGLGRGGLAAGGLAEGVLFEKTKI